MKLRMAPLLAGLAGLAATSCVAVRYGVCLEPRDIIAMAALALASIGCHAWASRSSEALRIGGSLLAAAVFAGAASRIAFQLFPIEIYGDGQYMIRMVEAGRTFSHWLAGSALLSWTYAAIWQFPPLALHWPAPLAGGQAFIGLTGAAWLLAAAAWALRWPRMRLAVYVTLSSTMWLVLAFGYIEYYPFLAGALMVFLAWLFSRPFAEHRPGPLGAALGGMACLYVGFWPIAGIVAATFVAANPRRNAPCAAWAALAFLAGIRLFWPDTPGHFFTTLWSEMNFGDQWLPPRYAGLAAGADSIYFRHSYALSFRHARELAALAFFSGALVQVLLAAVVGLAAWRAMPAGRRIPRITAGRVAFALLLGYYARFFVYKIPKLGPRLDLDLYFTFYLLTAFLLGCVLQRYAGRAADPRPTQLLFLSALAGTSAPLAYIMLYKGLPLI